MTVPYSINAVNMQFELVCNRGLDWPKYKFNIPTTVLEETVDNDQKTALIDLELPKDCQEITITNFGKGPNDTVVEEGKIVLDQSLIINKIWVNGVLLERTAIIKITEFVPEYTESVKQYAQENGLTLETQQHTLDLYHNGVWTFEFTQPFFTYYHSVLFEDINKFNYQYKRSHLGIADQEHLIKLENMLKQLS